MVNSRFRFIFFVLVFALTVARAAVPSDLIRDRFDEDACFSRLDADERIYLFGLQYLMNCFQWKQYLTLPNRAERDEWIETFWLYLDPTPTTPDNERRIEHEARVEAARLHYTIVHEPGWDRRGEIYIRFGAPDVRTIIDPDVTRYGASPPREQWYYERLEMLFSFADITHNGEYFYDEEIPYSLNTLLREAQQDAQAGRGKVIVWSVFIKDPFTMFPMMQPDLEKPNEGLAGKLDYCHAPDIAGARLPAYLDVTSFRGGPGKLKTEVNLEIPGDAVDIRPGAAARFSEIEFRVLVRDTHMDSVAFASASLTPAAPEILNRPYSDLIPGQVRVTLEPGYYRFGMEVIDRQTGRSASYRTSMHVPSLDGGLALSDILFAGRIRETEEIGRFVKGRLEVVPHPTHVYRKPRHVIFYFEVYGLDTDRDGLAFYGIEYTVTPLEKRRWGPVLLDVGTEISSSFETNGFGSTQPLQLTIDTAELREGSYELHVTVKDRRTMETVRQRSEFFVLD